MRRTLPALLPIILALWLAAPQPAHSWKAKRNEFNPAMIARYKGMLYSRPDDGFAFRKLMGLYQTYSTLDRLIIEYQNQLKGHPDHYSHNVVLGRIYLKIDRFTEAKQHLEKAIKKDQKRFEAYKNLGILHLKKARYALARTNLDLALKNVTKNKQIRERLLRELVRISVLGGDIDGGTKYFELLLKIRPGDFSTRWYFAELLAKGMHFKKAKAQYDILYKMVSGDTRRKVQVMKARGMLFEKMGKDKDAEKTYWKAMSLTAHGHWVRRELINRLLSIARRRDALPQLLKEFRKRWGSPSGFQYSMIARIYGEIGQFDNAIKYYRLAIRRESSNVDYRIELIALLEKSGASPLEIIVEQERLMRSAPAQLKYAVELAGRYEKAGKSKKAMALTRSLLAQNPTDASLLLAMADLYAQWNKPTEVIKMYEKLVRLEPTDPEHRINLGQQYWGRGKRDKAMKSWLHLIKPGMFPKKDEGFHALSTVLTEIGKYREALSYLKKAMVLAPDSPKYMLLHGQILIKMRQLSEAAKVFEETLRIAEKRHDVVMSKKVRKHLLTLWQELRVLSRELAKRRARWRPSKIDMGMFLAEGYTLMGKWADAEKIFRSMRKRKPALSEPLLGLIRLYESLGKYQGLIALLNEAIKLIPHRAQEFYESLSSTWALLGDDKRARYYLSLAIKKGAKDSKAWSKAGELAIKLEDYKGAIKAYKEAIRLDPYEMDYYFSLATLYLQTEKPAEATSVYHQIISRASEDELVEKAARHSMDIDELSGSLGALERVIYPLSFAYSHRPVFSKLLLQVYRRYVPALAYLRDNSKDKNTVAFARNEMKRLSTRALKPLLEALTSDSLQEMNEARSLLATLGNPNSAVPLIRMAKRVWERGLTRLAKSPDKNKFLSSGEFSFVRKSIYVAATIGDKSIYRELKFFAAQSRDVGVSFLGLWGISRLVPKSAEVSKSLTHANSVDQIKLACYTLSTEKSSMAKIKALIADRSRRLDIRIACLKAVIFRGSHELGDLVKSLAIKGSRYDMRSEAAALLPFTPTSKDISLLVERYLERGQKAKPIMAQGLLLAAKSRRFSELRTMDHPGLALGGTAFETSWMARLMNRSQLRSILYPTTVAARGKNVTLWMPQNIGYSSYHNKPLAAENPRIVLTPPSLPRGNCRNIKQLELAILKGAKQTLSSDIHAISNLLEMWNMDLSLVGFHSLCTVAQARSMGKSLYTAMFPKLQTLFQSESTTIREKMWFLAIITGRKSLASFLGTIHWKDSRFRVLNALILGGFSRVNATLAQLVKHTVTVEEKIAVFKLVTRGKRAGAVIREILADPDAVNASIGLDLLKYRPFSPDLLLVAMKHTSITVARKAYALLKARHPKSVGPLLARLPEYRRKKLSTIPKPLDQD
ncbi:tetratricopeptide repeat protein [Myxococcota bacterium]|nr:tetratricopeptide repeat protein [Myxococcota bacterium]